MKFKIFSILLLSTNLFSFKLGIENLSPALIQQLSAKKIGLVTNQTGVDQQGKRNIDILREKKLNVVRIFAPEHGFEGCIPASRSVSNMIDKKTGIPVVSLYSNATGKQLSESLLKDVDVLLFDMQDSGMRHYTYISTLFETVRAAGQYNTPLFVCDRPNPLGAKMSGPLAEPELISFISVAPMPLRPGMTFAELAQYFNMHILKKPAPLTVISMADYKRTNHLTNLIKPLSPNITNIHSCCGYSFLGLLGEVRPFDVGIGTSHAFQLITLEEARSLPRKRWWQLDALLQTHGIRSQWHRYLSERKHKWYTGLRLRITDINAFNSCATLLDVVDFFKQNNVEISFSQYFNKAAGNPIVQHYFQGSITRAQLAKRINGDLKKFFESVRSVFLYHPYPQLELL